jgi:hypothetical protein
MENKRIAAKMAGAWWAERLADDYTEVRPAFAAAVEKCVLQELNGECYWDWYGERHDGFGDKDRAFSEHDYDPHYLLVHALAEVLPNLPNWKLSNTLPLKHTLAVYADRLEPQEGYGNRTAAIPVSA